MNERKDTSEALLDAAEALFSEKGYAAVSTREIVERAGVNIAAINYHFGSKSELYLATVREAMSRTQHDSAWAGLREIPEDPREAATLLVRFIRTYLRHLLVDDGPRRTCGTLMLREAIEPTDAFDAVIRDYIRPGRDVLVMLVSTVLEERDRPHADHFARSILGQILHYRVFRSFIERLESRTLSVQMMDEAADHIARFSLRGMGFDDALIEQILEADRVKEISAAQRNGSD